MLKIGMKDNILIHPINLELAFKNSNPDFIDHKEANIYQVKKTGKIALANFTSNGKRFNSKFSLPLVYERETNKTKEIKDANNKNCWKIIFKENLNSTFSIFLILKNLVTICLFMNKP